MTKLNGLNTGVDINRYDSGYIISKGRLIIHGETKNVVEIKLNDLRTDYQNSVHYINIVDTSGSMHSNIGELKSALKEFARGIGSRDRVSMIEFSSPGKARLILENANLTDKSSLITYDSMVNGLYTCGSTCFSEPLDLAKRLIERSHVRDYLCVSIVTDGSIEGLFDKTREFEKCMETAEHLGKLVTAINTIGCGDFCDVDFLKKLSSFSQLGKYVHIDEVGDVRHIWSETLREMKAYHKASLQLSAKGSILYNNEFKTLLDKYSMSLYNINKDSNTIYLVLDENEDTFSINGIDYDINEVTNTMSSSDVSNLVSKWSKELDYQGDKDKAKEVLESISSLEKLNQTVTNKDREAREDKKPQITDYTNGLNLLSLLDRLKGNSYVDIETLDGYVSSSIKEARYNIEPITKKYSTFNGYSINSTGTNLNISFKHKVEVHFNQEDLNKVNLDSIIHNSVIVDNVKNYSIVKNGEYNISRLIMHVKTDVLGEILGVLCMNTTPFKVIEYINSSSIDNHKKVCFNLEDLPMVGEVIEDKFSNIYDKYVYLCKHKAIAKVLKYYIKLITDIFVNTFSDLNNKQIEFLKENGLDSKMNYSDKYTSRSSSNSKNGIAFSIKGASSMPSVDKVISMFKSGNTSSKFYDSIMFKVVQDCEYDMNHNTKEKCLDTWTNLLDFNKSRIKALEEEINKEKFERFVSGNYWSDCNDTYGDYPTCNISIIPKVMKRVAL